MAVDAGDLSDIERDALAEIANVGVSRAATSLRQMVGEQVLLSVPAVNIVSREAAAELVEKGSNPKLVAVQQLFSGPFSGRALLIFPQDQSLELVRSIVGDEHTPGRRHRSGAGSARRDGKYHSQWLLGDYREPATPANASVASLGTPRRRCGAI